jgi:hypothetical protein
MERIWAKIQERLGKEREARTTLEVLYALEADILCEAVDKWLEAMEAQRWA